MKTLEKMLEWGGIKRDITFLVISGIALASSLMHIRPAGIDPAWAAIILCGIPIILEAVIGLVTAFDIKADVLVSMALIASVIIGEIFAAGEVAGLYLNFSDPWPKSRHAKRRLTSPVFLAHYADVLQPEGAIQFKTDNRGLFEYSLASLNNFGLVFDGVWLDLHAATDGVEDIQTEYEQKFSAKGPIYQVIAHFPTEK